MSHDLNDPPERVPFDDAHLDSLAAEAKALAAIVEALRALPQERRLAVFRASSILATGKDPTI